MGCCSNDGDQKQGSCCKGSARAQKKSMPWLSLIFISLIILSIFYWQ